MEGEEGDRDSLAFISLQGLLPNSHLEVTPAGPGSPPPLLLFPWGQMSFQQQHQASAAHPKGEEGLGGGGAGLRALSGFLYLFYLWVSTVNSFLNLGPSL